MYKFKIGDKVKYKNRKGKIVSFYINHLKFMYAYDIEYSNKEIDKNLIESEIEFDYSDFYFTAIAHYQ